jgi:hypothetical protein
VNVFSRTCYPWPATLNPPATETFIMPIKIPPGAVVIRDRRLSAIKILSELTKPDGQLDTLKNAVKKTMVEKKATFVESDLAIGQLRSASSGANGERKFVDATKLHGLIKKGRITLEQFLSVLCVRTSLLPQILSGDEIAGLSEEPRAKQAESSLTACAAPVGALYTDFKPDLHVDLDEVLDSIGSAVAKRAA